MCNVGGEEGASYAVGWTAAREVDNHQHWCRGDDRQEAFQAVSGDYYVSGLNNYEDDYYITTSLTALSPQLILILPIVIILDYTRSTRSMRPPGGVWTPTSST